MNFLWRWVGWARKVASIDRTRAYHKNTHIFVQLCCPWSYVKYTGDYSYCIANISSLNPWNFISFEISSNLNQNVVHKQNWSLIISVKIVQVYTPYIKCDRSLIILWKFSDAQTMCNDWSMLLRYKIQSRQILHNADALINKRPTGLGGHLSTNVLLTALSLTCHSLIFAFWSLNPVTPLTVVPLLLFFKINL